jgi:glycosyltransferase involved in cell wall biosynthesis
VIPAHNEEVTVAGVVRGHRETARSLAATFELIVCDDGSTDGTWAELQRSCAEIAELRLLRNPSRLGIPPTMKRLYAEAQGEWIYFTPADGQVPAAALEPMWSIREGAALVVGLLRRIFRLPVHDIDSVKLYRTEDLRSVPPRSASNFFEAEILITLHTRGRTVREIDIPHRPRIAGIAEGVTPAGALLAMRDVATFTLRWLLRRDR